MYNVMQEFTYCQIRHDLNLNFYIITNNQNNNQYHKPLFRAIVVKLELFTWQESPDESKHSGY